jgi:hypothetical protein
MIKLQAAPQNLHPHPALSPQGRGIQHRRRLVWGALIGVFLVFLLLGCAPCCGWWGNGLNNNGKNGASVSGTAYITMNGQKSPVPSIDVTLSTSETKTAKYSTTTDSGGYFKLENVAPGTYFIRIAGGDLGWSDTITVKKDTALNLGDIQLHPTLPPPPPNTSTGNYPATPEDVIRAYYKAINQQDYSKALSYTAGNLAKMELDGIRGQYEPYVKNIEVVSIKRLEKADIGNEQMYQVTFQADYIKHYPAGSGNLQEFHTLLETAEGWKITGTGTGP